MAFLLPATGAAADVPISMHEYQCHTYSLYSPTQLAQHEHNNVSPEGIYPAAAPGITTPAGNQLTRSFPADSSFSQISNQTHRSFIFIQLVETFDNNQRYYNHPTHQFW